MKLQSNKSDAMASPGEGAKLDAVTELRFRPSNHQLLVEKQLRLLKEADDRELDLIARNAELGDLVQKFGDRIHAALQKIRSIAQDFPENEKQQEGLRALSQILAGPDSEESEPAEGPTKSNGEKQTLKPKARQKRKLKEKAKVTKNKRQKKSKAQDQEASSSNLKVNKDSESNNERKDGEDKIEPACLPEGQDLLVGDPADDLSQAFKSSSSEDSWQIFTQAGESDYGRVE